MDVCLIKTRASRLISSAHSIYGRDEGKGKANGKSKQHNVSTRRSSNNPEIDPLVESLGENAELALLFRKDQGSLS